MSRRLQRVLPVALALTVLGLTVYRPIVDLIVDYLWFDALGYGRLFSVELWTRVGLWTAAFGSTSLFLGWNVRRAWRAGALPFPTISSPESGVYIGAPQVRRLTKWVIAALIALVAVALAQVAAAQWLVLLSWLNAVPFGRVDPVFQRDVSFYVFTLPLISFLRLYLVANLVLALIAVGLVHGLRGRLEAAAETAFGVGSTISIDTESGAVRFGANLPPLRGRAHLHVLATLLMMLVAFGYWLRRFDVLYSRRGVVYGAGYTDLHAQIPAYWLMALVSVAVALVFMVTRRRRDWRVQGYAVVAFVATSLVLTSLFPAIVQNLYVTPNELSVEKPYLAANIEATRHAFALDRVEVRPFEAADNLTLENIAANPLTVKNIRLWDTRPLLTTYSQLQEIRLYYDFVDVDVDRYVIDGVMRQVMLAARELNYADVPATAQSWVNEHLQYTHGYGLTMSLVNVVDESGLPELVVRDIPPQTVADLPIERPEIYYGELTDRFVFVRTSAKEFDYPMGDDNVYTTYEGSGGVPLGGFFGRALFAAYFSSLDVLFTQYFTPETRVMFRRRILERASTLAPFLTFDDDPYLVVAEGRLVWVLDAYTTTDRYPYAEHDVKAFGRPINYIRNAVKVVIDAYNGSVDFYVSDDDDPIVKVYQRIFPGVFKAFDQLPRGLQTHLRYPGDFFDVQTTLYRAYHMTDPTVFYNKEDMWDLPSELYGGQAQLMQSYYLIMKLPGSDRAEFILLLPFVPTNRDNMISWLAARSDPPHYGRLVLFQFPKHKLIYGPRQIEARIDQDPTISELITLWSQAGSRVVRGNLLVIPIDDGLVYVEPLYLQAERSQLPELKRVIVSYDNRIAMRRTLDEALRAVFTGDGASPVDESVGGLATGDREVDAPPSPSSPLAGDPLLTSLTAAWDRVQHSAAEGDWDEYGKALDELSAAMESLRERLTPPR